MSNSFWRPSDEQRRTILLMEVAGLLHDVGKLSNGFIKKESKDKPEEFYYDYQLIANPNQVFPPVEKSVSKQVNEKQKQARNSNRGAPFKDCPDITDSLQSQSFQGWDSQTYNLAEILLGQFASQDLASILSKSFQPATLIRELHGIAHYEKEDTDREHNNQSHVSMYASSPFGIESCIHLDFPEKNLNHALTSLPLKNISKIYSKSNRRQWLEEDKDGSLSVRHCLSFGIADTCRPTNEVSLWDWGFTVAALTKAATAYIFKNGWPSDIKSLPFCTLRINLDTLECYTHSDKISDLLGVQQTLDDAFRNVQTLLEETYALGNQFYRDETGAYYLLPNIFGNAEKIAIREEIQSLFPPDLLPQVHFSNPVTAGELDADKSRSRELVAEPRNNALGEKSVSTDNNLYLFETEWKDGCPKNAEICTVCGIRPVGYPRQGSQFEAQEKLSEWATQKKAERRKICRICLNRRGRRSEAWVQGSLQDTIWTDEVADDNGRLALFVGKLGLEGWLDGTLLSTIQVTSTLRRKFSYA